MHEATAGTGLLVHLAALLQLLGLLNRNQLCLRLLVLLGSVAYVAYYYAYPDRPLWGAIFWSSVLAAANILGIGRILWARAGLGRSGPRSGEEHRSAQLLRMLAPGELRGLLRLARWRAVERRTLIVEEDRPVASLYFVLEGRIEILKAGRAFPIEPKVFIGEVAFLLDTTASASVFLEPGARYLEWSAAELRQASARDPALGQAMQALFARQLASKVANAWRMPPLDDDPRRVPPADRDRGPWPAAGLEPSRC